MSSGKAVPVFTADLVYLYEIGQKRAVLTLRDDIFQSLLNFLLKIFSIDTKILTDYIIPVVVLLLEAVRTSHGSNPILPSFHAL